MKYYLAYGSNLNIEQMKQRCPGAKAVDTAIINGWELSFKGSKTGSYLTIDKKTGGQVPVAVWAVTNECIDALDRYEGYPTFYKKHSFNVQFINEGGWHECFAYVMRPDAVYGIPTHYYYSICQQGYEYFNFDENILRKALERSRGGRREHIQGKTA